ncbi:hypothetical protein ASC94_00400 [Massilia sp. Root418]|uniref:hypothetical protein n=1 Tax=Massilia sp. Root418 TaxID=1736532 RepID=UPI0006F8A73D|nr:hypothetical protein [Massilia sp. Root418]KQX01152.1 hypothetical protein ASC94_00400 [Massilia sp. Root418]
MSQQINLFNPRFLKQKNYFSAAALAGVLAVVLVGGIAMGLVARRQAAALEAQANSVKNELAAREARRAAAATELAPRQRSATVQQELEQAEAEHRALLAVSAILDKGEFGNTRGYSAYFKAFARSRVDGLWLTGVQIVGAGNEIGLQGRTLQASLLPGYLSGLSREPVLKGTSFGQLEMAQPKAADAGPAAAPAPNPAPPGGTAAPPAPAVAPYIEFSLQAMPAGAKAEGL